MVWDHSREEAVVPYLEWAINTAAVEHLKDHYLVHAGVVACGDTGVILPAASGSGKTTMVAALVAEGCRYLSDEVAVIDPRAGALLPFAKSLYIRAASRELLAPSYPELRAAASYSEADGQPLWYLPPRSEWLPVGPVPLRVAVIPQYLPGAATVLAPAARSTVLGCLLEQSFNLQQHGGAGIAGLARLLQETACYTLTYGDLSDAVAALLDEVRE